MRDTMIGFYDYTVILTYISLASSILGMISACYARIGWAIFFLGMSGLLDTFDGKVARTKKNRTEDQKRFGIQIDSLCDIVCFGVCPVIICWFSGMQAPWEVSILISYCLAGLIRLAYYNVMEEKRQQETDEKRKYYQGLPITSIAVILPFLYAISNLCQDNFEIVLSLAMLLTGLLFVLNFKFPKPNNKQLTVLIIVVAAVVLYLLFCFNWKEYYGWNLSDLMFWKHKKG